jgi:hypothetical protein
VPFVLPDLVCVDPARIDEFWPHVKHFIRCAIEETGLSDFADIERDVLAGNQLLWLVWNGQSIEGAGTTQLFKGVCVITAFAGHQRERWQQLVSHVEKYAADEGCNSVRIYGRKGWERVLNGYRADYVILEKALA